MEDESLFYRLGEENLHQLVNHFYDRVFENEEIKGLFKTDKETIKTKQFLFLTQFFGGPQRYAEKYGHPRMRARHLPHNITEDNAVAWLKCMSEAIDMLPVSKELKEEIFNRFPQTAFFMVNSA